MVYSEIPKKINLQRDCDLVHTKNTYSGNRLIHPPRGQPIWM